jgi:hypothetical protein
MITYRSDVQVCSFIYFLLQPEDSNVTGNIITQYIQARLSVKFVLWLHPVLFTRVTYLD